MALGWCYFGTEWLLAAWNGLRAAGIVLVKLGKLVRTHKAWPKMASPHQKEAMSKMTTFTIIQDSPGHFDVKLLARFIRLAVQNLDETD